MKYVKTQCASNAAHLIEFMRPLHVLLPSCQRFIHHSDFSPVTTVHNPRAINKLISEINVTPRASRTENFLNCHHMLQGCLFCKHIFFVLHLNRRFCLDTAPHSNLTHEILCSGRKKMI